MTIRPDQAGFRAAAPASAAELEVSSEGLEPALVELVKIRSAQLGRCRSCAELYRRQARRQGEAEARLQALARWREAGLYSVRERAALAWTEAMTEPAAEERLRAAARTLQNWFTPRERLRLTLLIMVMSCFNRSGPSHQEA